MAPCPFDSLFSKNVPHIFEKIFQSLDYESYKACIKVNKALNKLIASEAFQKRAKVLFRKEILLDEEKLWLTSKNGDVEGTKSLLSIGLLDVNCIRGPNQLTALSEAAYRGHINIVNILLDAGADPNKEEKHGCGHTPLLAAIMWGSKEIGRAS